MSSITADFSDIKYIDSGRIWELTIKTVNAPCEHQTAMQHKKKHCIRYTDILNINEYIDVHTNEACQKDEIELFH